MGNEASIPCTACGQANAPGLARCAACGTELPAGVTPDSPTFVTPHRADSVTELTPVGTGAGLASGSRLDTLGPGTRLGERYEIVGVLGAGGMGVVYRARDLRLDRDVALKVIRPELTRMPGILERFHREIVLASKVTHRHILRIHDLVEADGLSFISMQFVEGTTLHDVLEREGRLTPERAVAIAVQLCEALQAAHDAGVVHRDLKPQNVLLDAKGQTYIADFGISRSLETGHTMTEHGQVIGTVDYMSPEQARGETPDHRGDLYALGMVLYRMLTGALPHAGLSSITAVLRRVQEEVPEVRTSRSDLPPWLSAVVSRALRRDPAERYASADAMRADLLGQQAVRRPWRLPRPGRRPLLWGGAAAVLALMIGATALFYRGGSTGPPPAPRASLALLPFVNGSGDPRYDWVEAGLPELVHTDLLQSPLLRLLGAERAAGVMGDLELGSAGEADPQALARLAGLLGTDNLLLGKLLKAGDRFRLEASLQHVVGGSIALATPIRVEGEGEDALFGMVDELSRRVRQDLGVERGWGETDRPVAEASTRSVAALGLYGDARERTRDGSYQEASALLEQALQHDPEFGLARALLADTLLELGHGERALTEAEAAVRGLGPSAPALEAARIRATKARIEGDVDAALAAWNEIATLAPNDADVLLELAGVQETQGQLETALATLDRVRTLDPRNPTVRYLAGRLKVKLGRAEEALDELGAARDLQQQLGNREGLATTLRGLGNTLFQLSRYDEAEASFEEALALGETIGDRRGVRVALNNLAVIERTRGRHAQALERAEQALAVSREMEDTAGEAEVWSIIGDTHLEAGRPEEAQAAYQESLKRAREIDDQAVTAQSLANLGYINAVLGRFSEAFIFQKEALDKRRELGDRADVLRSLIDLGFLEQVSGRYDKALEYYTEGIDLAGQTGERAAAAVIKGNVAELHAEQGRYRSALALLDTAEAAAAELGDAAQQASCGLYRARTLARAGDLTRAGEALAGARRLAGPLDNRALAAELATAAGELQLAGGSRRDAATTLAAAVRLAERSGDRRLVLQAQLRAAEAGDDLVRLRAVTEDCRSAGLARSAVEGDLAIARMVLAARKADVALEAADRAAGAARRMQARDLVFQAEALAAMAREGRSPVAADRHAAALAALEDLLRQAELADPRALLGRPDVVRFIAEAGGAFARAGRAPESARLAAIGKTS